MKEYNEKKIRQKKENERRLLEAQNKKEVAILEAEAEKIKLSAFIDKAAELATKLKKRSFTDQEIASLLHAYIGTRGENDTKIVSLGMNDNKISEAIAAEVAIQKNK